MPVLPKEDAVKLIAMRASEWTEFNRHWRFLADSYEGGHRYKLADYTQRSDIPQTYIPAIGGASLVSQNIANGFDTLTSTPNTVAFGRITDRNLVPHLSETEPAGQDIYALRLARTPVPKKLEMVVRRHLGRIYAREVQRDGPTGLQLWWDDVDGCGTPIDKWMRKTVAPLLCVLGQVDLCFDHPAATADSVRTPATKADARAAGLDRCVASYILPENMLWWRLDHARRYAECLVLERHGGSLYFRHWTDEDSVLYADNGEVATLGGVPQVHPHSFGRVPIRRVFDDRKPRCDNVGQPRYEAVADYQKTIYNALSEQILCDVMQSHPLLQGPEGYTQGENAVTVGPTGVLPMMRTSDGNKHEGWSFVDPPKGAADALREHLQDYAEEVDRNAALTRPAGASGTGSSTVSQSGVSKSFDSQEGNDYLAEVASTLEDCEKAAAEMVMLVLGDGTVDVADLDSLVVTYPREFDLVSGDDLADNLTDMHSLAAGAGDLPETSKEYMKRKLRVDMPGLPDERRLELEREIEELCDRRQTEREEMAEAMGPAGMLDDTTIGDDGRNQPQSTLTAQTQTSN